MSKRKFLVVLGIMLLAVGGYWYWQINIKIPQDKSPESPVVAEGNFTGWKTYRNEKYGFEVGYPPTHEVRFFSGYKLGEFSVCKDEQCIKFLAIYQGPLNELSGPYQNYRRINESDYLRGIFYYYSIDTENRITDQILSTFKFIK